LDGKPCKNCSHRLLSSLFSWITISFLFDATEYGHLYIWGRALIGQYDNDQPRSVFPSLSISQVALGWHHALLLSGMLYAHFLSFKSNKTL
jgi:hypothetical protein